MLAIGADHGGINLKEILKNYLAEKGIEVKDYGTFDTSSCDYPDIAEKVCDAILSGECERGILVCGTGIGMSIAANKKKPGQGKLEIEFYNDGDLETLLKQLGGDSIFNDD